MRRKETRIDGNKLVDGMNTFQLSRWIALFEGINLVADKAEQVGRRFNGISIKPNLLEEYVDHTSELVYRELTREESI